MLNDEFFVYQFGEAEEDGGVAVVTAAVTYGQGVDVGAEGDGGNA